MLRGKEVVIKWSKKGCKKGRKREGKTQIGKTVEDKETRKSSVRG